MAVAVQNTLVGLGQTIDLLKQILTEVKNTKQDGNIQPADMTVSKRITKSSKNESAISNTTDAIASVSKVNTKGLSEKATTISNTIKTLTSKEVTSGITKLGLLYATGIVGMFNKGIKSIFDTMVEMNNSFGGKFARIKSFNEAIDGFSKSINSLTNMIIKTATLTILIIPSCVLISLGFLAITGTFMLTKKLFNVLSNISQDITQQDVDIKSFGKTLLSLSAIILVGAAVGILAMKFIMPTLVGLSLIGLLALGTSKLFTYINSVGSNMDNAKGFLIFTAALYSLAGLVVVATAVGALAIAFIPQILAGFVALSGITIMAALTFKMISSAGEYAIKSSTGFLIFTAALYSLAGIVAVTTLVGEYVKNNWKNALVGFAAMTAITLGAIGVFLLLNYATPIAISAAPAFLIMTVALLGLSYLTSHIISIGKEINAAGGVKGIGTVLLTLGGLVISVIGIMVAVGSLASISLPIAAIGIAATVAIVSVINRLSKVVKRIVDVTKEIDTLGGVKGFEKRATILTSCISNFIGKIFNILDEHKDSGKKFKKLIKPLGKLINACSKFVKMLSGFTTNSNGTLSPVFYNDNGSYTVGAPIDIVLAGTNIGNAFGIFVNTLLEKFDNFDKQTAKLTRKFSKSIKRIMDPVCKFVNLLKSFKSDGINLEAFVLNSSGEIIFDNQGKPKTYSVNLISTSESISGAFGIFADRLFTSLEGKDKKIMKVTKKFGKSISTIMDPVSKFTNILKTFISGTNNEIFALVTKNGEIVFDKKGNPKTYSINVKEVSTHISNAFMTFANGLLEKLTDIETSGISKRTTKILASIMDPVNAFVDTVMQSNWDSSGKLIKDGKSIDLSLVGQNIGKSLSEFFTNLDTALPNAGPFSGANNKKTALEGYSVLLSSLGSFLQNSDKLSSSINTDITNNISTFLKDIYNTADNIKASDSAIELVSNTKELTDTLFKNAQTKIKNLKEYYANTKLIAEQLERAANAMEKISKHQDLEINIKNNQQNVSGMSSNNNQASQNATNTTTNINNTTNYNNVPGRQINTNNEIDYSEIVKAIRDGFDGISKMTVVMDSGDEINLDLAFGR